MEKPEEIDSFSLEPKGDDLRGKFIIEKENPIIPSYTEVKERIDELINAILLAQPNLFCEPEIDYPPKLANLEEVERVPKEGRFSPEESLAPSLPLPVEETLEALFKLRQLPPEDRDKVNHLLTLLRESRVSQDLDYKFRKCWTALNVCFLEYGGILKMLRSLKLPDISKFVKENATELKKLAQDYPLKEVSEQIQAYCRSNLLEADKKMRSLREMWQGCTSPFPCSSREILNLHLQLVVNLRNAIFHQGRPRAEDYPLVFKAASGLLENMVRLYLKNKLSLI